MKNKKVPDMRNAGGLARGRLKIGWAALDITPDRPCTLCGQFHTRITAEVRDPLTATALAIECGDGAAQTVIISIDAVWCGEWVRERFDARLRQILPEVAPEHVLISGTHTHTAPTQPGWLEYECTDPGVITAQEYGEFLVERLVEVTAAAWRARAAGAVAWGCGNAVVGYNRRAVYMDESATMYGQTNHPLFSHVEGHENHGVDLLFTFADDGRPTGAVVNLACPSQCTEGDNQVSADFWHDARTEIRRRHGAGFFVLGQCAAAGDQAPRPIVERRAQERMLRLAGLLPETGGDFNSAQRIEIGRRIADAVDYVLPLAAKDRRDTAELAHLRLDLNLPLRRMSVNDHRTCSERLDFWRIRLAEFVARGVPIEDHGHSTAITQVKYYSAALEQESTCAAGGTAALLPVQIHIIRLGDIAFCSNRFELLLDFGERIKARSPAVQTFIVQLAGGGSYLATRRAERAGGYGAWIASALCGADGGQELVEATLTKLQQMFASV